MVRRMPVLPEGKSTSSQLVTNVIKLVGGTTVAQAFTIITAPIISRLYAPTYIGTTGLFVSIVLILNVFVCLRYEQAIMLPKDDGEAANLFALSILATLLMSSLTMLFASLGNNFIPRILNAPEIAPFLWLIPLAVLIQGIFLATSFWNSRTKRFGRLSIARVAASFSTSVIPIIMALVGYANATGLIISYLVGSAIFTSVLFGQVIIESMSRLRQEILATRILAVLKRYRKFPLLDTWGSLINTLSWQLPFIMLSIYFSQTDIGHYSMANRIILLPMTLIGNAIAQVFFQQASEARAVSGSITRTVEMVFQRLVAISLPIAIVLALFGPQLFIFVLGPQWEKAGLYAQILAPWMFFLFVSSPLSTIFAVLEKQEQILLVHIAILVSRAFSLIVGGSMGEIRIALLLWSVSGIIVYGALAVWNLRAAGAGWGFMLRIFIRYLPAGIGYAGVLLFSKFSLVSTWSLVLIAGGLTAIYYLWVISSDAGLMNYLRGFAERKAVK